MKLLESLKRYTTVVADTGDFHSIEKRFPCEGNRIPN